MNNLSNIDFKNSGDPVKNITCKIQTSLAKKISKTNKKEDEAEEYFKRYNTKQGTQGRKKIKIFAGERNNSLTLRDIR